MTPHHRKDDPPGYDPEKDRKGVVDSSGLSRDTVYVGRLWQIAILLSIAFTAGGAAMAYKYEREANTKRYEELKQLIISGNFRPDPWTGTNMYTFAATFAEWHNDKDVPNPFDIQGGGRVRRIKLDNDGVAKIP